MNVKLRIEYRTTYGENLYVVTENGPKKGHPMHYIGGDLWECTLKPTSEELVYHYELRNSERTLRTEWGAPHHLTLDGKMTTLHIYDRWQQMPTDRSFYSTMFTEGVFARTKRAKQQPIAAGEVVIRAEIAQVRPDEQVILVGDAKQLGQWEVKKGIEMSDADFPVWSAHLKADKLQLPFMYKFVIVKRETGEVLSWELGENNYFAQPVPSKGSVLIDALRPRFNRPVWRGAGVAIPVFALRSEQSFGVGEFYDLKLMVDWAASTGQSIIQILPVNDTTMTNTWQDSYPYNANSTFALHPQFLRLEEVGELNDKAEMERYRQLGQELNALTQIDYERVNEAKRAYLWAIYRQEGKKTFRTKAFKEFMATNSHWLRPYAVFCALRDAFSTPDFNAWGKWSKYTAAKAAKYEEEHPEEVAFNHFVQFHLDRQLRAVRDYAHSKGVVLKGDIPIGISRTSVDAWANPELFNMDSSAGAPPDDFSVMGQNWGFPTYNWAKMAEDGYAWWKARFVKMAEYFDAYRIDHILGFFRIWEIPLEACNALLGRFNPALPFSVDEIQSYGFRFNPDWHTAPIEATDNVLFIEDKYKRGHYHPRISAHSTSCYQQLPGDQKEAYNHLYNDFFYYRHNDFWYGEAMKKLPPLIEATGMLVCGEDLGMIPHCVPSVMEGEQILSLEIQRMPKDPQVEFAHPQHYPYLSVCTTSTHDMNPIRAWWEEDRALSQRFFNQVLGAWGEAPYFCEPWICELVVEQHLKSPAMLTILPWQDWVAMDGKLRRENPNEERINVPANSRHYWRYRMHMTLEELLSADEMNQMIRRKIKESGR